MNKNAQFTEQPWDDDVIADALKLKAEAILKDLVLAAEHWEDLISRASSEEFSARGMMEDLESIIGWLHCHDHESLARQVSDATKRNACDLSEPTDAEILDWVFKQIMFDGHTRLDEMRNSHDLFDPKPEDLRTILQRVAKISYMTVREILQEPPENYTEPTIQ